MCGFFHIPQITFFLRVFFLQVFFFPITSFPLFVDISPLFQNKVISKINDSMIHLSVAQQPKRERRDIPTKNSSKKSFKIVASSCLR